MLGCDAGMRPCLLIVRLLQCKENHLGRLAPIVAVEFAQARTAVVLATKAEISSAHNTRRPLPHPSPCHAARRRSAAAAKRFSFAHKQTNKQSNNQSSKQRSGGFSNGPHISTAWSSAASASASCSTMWLQLFHRTVECAGLSLSADHRWHTRLSPTVRCADSARLRWRMDVLHAARWYNA